MLFVGIDPGKQGALAALDTDALRRPALFSMPLMDTKVGLKAGGFRQCIDVYELNALFRAWDKDNENMHVVVEELWGFGTFASGLPQQGQWNFARDYGAIQASLIALQIPHTMVAPQVWQKSVQKTGGKEGSIIRALSLFPESQPDLRVSAKSYHDGKAEALLLAWHGFKEIKR